MTTNSTQFITSSAFSSIGAYSASFSTAPPEFISFRETRVYLRSNPYFSGVASAYADYELSVASHTLPGKYSFSRRYSFALSSFGPTLVTGEADFEVVVPSPPGSPEVPILAEPARQSTCTPLTPSFAWSNSTGADSYRLQVSRDAGFRSLVIDETNIVSTHYQPSQPLAAATRYFWRVRAVNSAGLSFWTEPAAFVTASDQQADGVPTLEIERTTTGVTVRWPVASCGFVLETSSGQLPQITWSVVTHELDVENEFYRVTLPADASAGLFRLRKQ